MTPAPESWGTYDSLSLLTYSQKLLQMPQPRYAVHVSKNMPDAIFVEVGGADKSGCTECAVR